LLVAGFSILAVLAGLLGLRPDSVPQDIEYSRIMDVALPERPSPLPRLEASIEIPASTTYSSDPGRWQSVVVKSGQTLDTIFREVGLSTTLLHNMLALNNETRGLRRIRPGDVFEFLRDESGGLNQMRYALDERRTLIVSNDNGKLSAEIDLRELMVETHEASGVISSSLFHSGKEAGLSDAMVMKLAYIFGWDIDFVLDIREGDRFHLVFEKLYREGEFLRDGEILAATFINQGERFQAVRFDDDGDLGYFAPDGRNMRKAFLRAPLNFSYISSGFNPRRMHPVLKRVRPHNGIDYYAPRGTPVYAAGAGKVIRSAYSNANGHHVFIEHDGSIVTKYLHFTNRAVKAGQRVKQGQVIGYVGSTGLATGPHLHYEFLVNNVHRNPRTVPLPKVEALKEGALAAFQTHASPYLTRLSRMESASLYASRD
jgi:murein DD-endopeptidase MepM/ murein hydrolase activator NlpD